MIINGDASSLSACLSVCAATSGLLFGMTKLKGLRGARLASSLCCSSAHDPRTEKDAPESELVFAAWSLGGSGAGGVGGGSGVVSVRIPLLRVKLASSLASQNSCLHLMSSKLFEVKISLALRTCPALSLI